MCFNDLKKKESEKTGLSLKLSLKYLTVYEQKLSHNNI